MTRISHYAERLLVYILVIAGAILTAMPFVWMFLTSFKGPADVASIPLRWLPTRWRFDNYAEIFNMLPFARFYVNSVFVATCQVFGVLITASMAAYSFARIKFWGRDVVLLLYLGTIMIPGWITVIPLFLIVKQLGWLDHYQGVIVPGLTSAMGTFLLRQFFQGVPKDYEEAAFIDGAGRFRVYAQVILPLAKPALLTVGLLTLMKSWNDLLWPLLVLSDIEMQTIPLGLARLALAGGWVRIEWGPLMGATLLSVLPVIVVYAFLQNYFIRGIALSGLK